MPIEFDVEPKANEGMVEVDGLDIRPAMDRFFNFEPVPGLIGRPFKVAPVQEIPAVPPIPEGEAPWEQKEVFFEGERFLVPGWTEWITQDKDGRVMAFSDEPFQIAGKHMKNNHATKQKEIAKAPYRAVKQRV